jgi:hypothetical protein
MLLGKEVRQMGKISGLKPGSKTPASGQYITIGPRGGEGPEITSVQGKPLPATPKPGSTYTLVDPTKNDSGKGK